MSFYTSLNGLKNAQIDLGVISHNIANAETTGFKKLRAEFADIVVGASYTKDAQGIGATVESVSQNFSLGPLEQTGNVLDLAINGEGFFTTRDVKTDQLLFTRNGAFHTDGQGFMTDASGYRLQVLATAADGTVTGTTPFDVQVPSVGTSGAEFASVVVNREGQVVATFADGSNEIVGTLALANFVSTAGLIQAGSSNWEASGNSGAPRYGAPGTSTFGDIISGAIERSNVDIAEELVGLITAQRNFQANAKAIDTASQISQTIINLRT
ncbi:MAG: flagellar hook basal-body protein [Sphingomonadaceae bacterium]|nr:flagellar hook basal-body protein [Sphingomonadaceae bacterium]